MNEPWEVRHRSEGERRLKPLSFSRTSSLRNPAQVDKLPANGPSSSS